LLHGSGSARDDAETIAATSLFRTWPESWTQDMAEELEPALEQAA
jgi:hypothetical protein